MHLSSQLCGSTNRIAVQVNQGIKQNPILKITNARKVSEVAQVVEHLPSKFKVLRSTPIALKKKKRKD
jgi:hypothetical protein